MPLPPIRPPLVNSANPWATTLADLQALFNCPSTGAVTTRTCLLNGFEHDSAIHQYTFFNVDDHKASRPDSDADSSFTGSLNTLGYSPVPLATYLSMLGRIMADSKLPDSVRRSKPFIISVTGSSEAVVECYKRIQALQAIMPNPLCMEINLSCPNIPDKPPPAYCGSSLTDYLHAFGREKTPPGQQRVAIGIKTPPYTYHDQFQILIDALLAASTPTCPVDFITATNTLGSSLILGNELGEGGVPALNSASGAGIGGMAGAPLHPLALGNVKTIRTILDKHDQLKGIAIIGVGGVSDHAGFQRMRAVGAEVVGVGTALGRKGVGVFEDILSE
ncbi:related to dihydroorotate dehydrogenase A [Lecanosticta acicola]|uniref:Dihydroorotate dehydrogenase (fumarate) n=1 Tax=Lecanosticta acicola TaxID=111012 RepID=A0AAI9EBX0_9PEZI|nr:related to dihydroorotate dehydrogenase A [Lecanosticta acicola]